jgi:peptide-methionine (S)-S-oxide reductase
MPQADQALPGRRTDMPLRNVRHGRALRGDFSGLQRVQFGLGCFWAERKFCSVDGVESTAVGDMPKTTWREVCVEESRR